MNTVMVTLIQLWDKWLKCFTDQNLSAKNNWNVQTKKVFNNFPIEWLTKDSVIRSLEVSTKGKCSPTSWPFQSRMRHFSCRTLQSYNSPVDWARELFKPSTDSASLVVKIKKKQFLFLVGCFRKVTSERGHVLEK